MIKAFLKEFVMNKRALVRYIVFLFAWINTYLASHGMQELPVLSEEGVSYFLTFVISLWTLMTDNTLKKKGE